MKLKLYGTDAKKIKDIDVPAFTQKIIREDLIQKIVEAKKNIQPYGPSPVAGNQYSASGKLKHHRKVWKSQYGRGMSRIPRKAMSVRGSQFNWVGATVPNARGGRRAHPPKPVSMMGTDSVNKKELALALKSALAASLTPSFIQKKYLRLQNESLESVPAVLTSDSLSLKTKDLLSLLKKVLGEKAFDVAIQTKTQRSGKGKLRGRKYKKSAGLIFVVGNNEKLKTTAFDVQVANKLSVVDLAKGGPGRLAVFTEQAIKDLEEKIK